MQGCIITIDAMGCQKDIAQQIVDGGYDYLLAVKSNQGELYGNIKEVFECSAREGTLETLFSPRGRLAWSGRRS